MLLFLCTFNSINYVNLRLKHKFFLIFFLRLTSGAFLVNFYVKNFEPLQVDISKFISI